MEGYQQYVLFSYRDMWVERAERTDDGSVDLGMSEWSSRDLWIHGKGEFSCHLSLGKEEIKTRTT